MCLWERVRDFHIEKDHCTPYINYLPLPYEQSYLLKITTFRTNKTRKPSPIPDLATKTSLILSLPISFAPLKTLQPRGFHVSHETLL